MPLDSGLLDILVCPACHAPLNEETASGGRTAAKGADPSTAEHAPSTGDNAPQEDTELLCTSSDCGLVYPVRDGIPVLLVDEARRPA